MSVCTVHRYVEASGAAVPMAPKGARGKGKGEKKKKDEKGKLLPLLKRKT